MMDQAIHNKIVSFIRGIETNLGSRSHLTALRRFEYNDLTAFRT